MIECELCSGPMPTSFRVIDDDGNKRLICIICFTELVHSVLPRARNYDFNDNDDIEIDRELSELLGHELTDELLQRKIQTRKASKSTWFNDIDELIASTKK